MEEGDTAEWDGKDRDEDGTDEVHEDRDGENQAGKVNDDQTPIIGNELPRLP